VPVKIVGWILLVFGAFMVIGLPAEIRGKPGAEVAGAVTVAVVVLGLAAFFLVQAYREERLEREYAEREARPASSSTGTPPPPLPPPPLRDD